jgi:hypothetical protein
VKASNAAALDRGAGHGCGYLVWQCSHLPDTGEVEWCVEKEVGQNNFIGIVVSWFLSSLWPITLLASFAAVVAVRQAQISFNPLQY